VVAFCAAAVGIFIESADAVSVWMDAVSIYVIPLGALLAAIMFFWLCPKGFAREQVQKGREKKLGAWFEPVTDLWRICPGNPVWRNRMTGG
jgi:NSS family neurotransmitter:Na+ symporter